jgi:Flp pilus assembly protein TadG
MLSKLRFRLKRGRRGQSLVELALTLPILVLLSMGIIDLGYALYAHVQVAAASGEGANVGSRMTLEIDLNNYNQNDYDRQRLQAVSRAVMRSMGRLNLGTPNFSPLTDPIPNNYPLPQAATDDILVTYSPASSANATRVASMMSDGPEEIIVRVKYRQPLLFGFLPNLLTFSGREYLEVSTTTRARIQ